jgi:hypothetical protein
MQKNMSTTDGLIRLVLAAVFAVIAVLSVATLPIAGLAALGTVVMAATALTGRCPLYHLIGLSTCRRQAPR